MLEGLKVLWYILVYNFLPDCTSLTVFVHKAYKGGLWA